ncbi:MAG: MFS transporter [Paraprevotella sp.]|nr:MFS transporter [Paraprevotella sp.]
MEQNQMTVPEGRIVGNLDWDGLHRPHIYYAMVAIFSGLFLSVTDCTICNVALPTIARQLHISSSDSIWVVNAFQLIIVMSLLPFSSVGELFGFKRTYLCGMVCFTLGSLCCTLSSTFVCLVLSRMLQGVGAAMIMSVNGSLVKLIYPKRYLARGFGLNATIVALSSVAGPTIAGAILSVANWPWLFAVNLPVGVLTFFLAHKFLPDNPTRVEGRKFDFHSALLNALTFGLLIGCIEAFSHGVPFRWISVGIVLLAVVGTVFVRHQLHQDYPILPFDLLRIPVFSLSVLTSILSFTAQMLGMIAVPFMFHLPCRLTAAQTVLLMTSWPLGIVVAGPLAGTLATKIHPGILGGIGLSVMSVGCFLLSMVSPSTGYVGLMIRLILCGFGFGLFQSPNNLLLLSSAPTYRSGGARGMLSTARLVGQSMGAALVSLLSYIRGDNAPHEAML